MTGVDRPFTLAAVPAVERRCRETLDAILSRLGEAAGEALITGQGRGLVGRDRASGEKRREEETGRHAC